MRTHKCLIPQNSSRLKGNPLWAVTLAILLCGPHILFADVSTLERIIEAEHEVSYVGLRWRTSSSSRGTRTFEEYVIHPPGEASYRKVISVVGERRSLNDKQRRDERLSNNKRKGNEDHNRDTHRRESDQNRWRRIKGPFTKKEIDLIARNYTLEHRTLEEKIADHETDLLIISPKFPDRPTKHVFFARKNGIILRVEALDAAGVLREMFVYTRISFDPTIVKNKWDTFQKDIKPEPQRSHSISLAESEKVLKTTPIRPQYIPPGFQLHEVHRIKSRENNSILLAYTDGLVNFTLFEKTGKPPRLGNRARGEQSSLRVAGTLVYKHRLGPTDAFRWSVSDIHFLLLGTMPTTEMQKVVESIIHKAKTK